jgi:hypothetical protein
MKIEHSFKFIFTLLILICINACKKDKTNPVINLIGDSVLEIGFGISTTDPGANAYDETDGDVTASLKSDWNETVNVNKTGRYMVTYTVVDKGKNKAIAFRQVIVKYGVPNFVGDYNNVYTNIYGTSTNQWTTNISIGDNNKQIKVNNFEGLGYYFIANINESGTEFEIPTQLVYTNLTFSGTGYFDPPTSKLYFTYTEGSGSNALTASIVLSKK